MNPKNNATKCEQCQMLSMDGGIDQNDGKFYCSQCWNTYQSQQSQKQQFRYLVVLDFEATCDADKRISPQEIIEWPAMIIDTKTNTILKGNNCIFHHYIKPKHHKKLTPFCTELTGITQSLLNAKGAKNVHVVVAKWNKWCFENGLLSSNTAVVTHGDWDLKTMWTTQQKLSKCADAALFHSWINIKKIFEFSKLNKGNHFGLGMMSILKYLGIEHEGRHHSGIDDVKNICKIAQMLLKHGVFFHYTTTNFKGRNAMNDVQIKQRQMQQNKKENDEKVAEKSVMINDESQLRVGNICMIQHLKTKKSKKMNGKFCKILGEFDVTKQKYPVFVISTQERCWMMRENLQQRNR